MFRTKKDIDKHVTDILNKINNENERNLRGYTFARLYFQVGEYEKASRYLAGYLSIRDSHALAHKLMAEIYTAKGNLERAIQSYKRSIEIDPCQKDIVLKICELYCQLPVDHEIGKYWADRADHLFPHHNIVFRLRECLVNADGEPDHKGLEKLITAELLARPQDVGLHIKLLKLYIDTERIKEAYSYALKIESKRAYPRNVEWYYCLTEIFEAYQEEADVQLDSRFYYYFLTILDHLVGLTLTDSSVLSFYEKCTQDHGVCDAACTLNTFDRYLHKAWKLPVLHEEDWGYFLQHMRGQLYFRVATLLLKRAKKEQGNWKEACRISAALFLTCYSFKPNNPKHVIWYTLHKDKQELFNFWYQQGTERICQSGYIIRMLCNEEKVKWLTKIKQETCLPQVRERIYNRLFSNTKKKDSSSSHFLEGDTFLTCSLEYPEIISLQEYTEVAHKLHPDSLHHLVWLALQINKQEDCTRPQHDYKFQVFDGLQSSSPSLTHGAAESLCQLDIDAFLYATIHTSQLEIDHRRAVTRSQTFAPLSLPADIADPLCSREQATWWQTTYKLHTNSAREKLGEMRRILQRGLEVIRGVGVHGMDVRLIIHLARIFADRATNIRGEDEVYKSEEIASLKVRARHYWKLSLNMLDKIASNQTIRLPKERLFCSNGPGPSSEEIDALREEGQLFLACRAMDEAQLEEAASILINLSSPYASFYLALTLKRLAEKQIENKHRREIPSNIWNTHISLLTRARDALYSTLDRIQNDSKHPLNLELQKEIEYIENQLATVDSGIRTNIYMNGTEDEDESLPASRNGSVEDYKEQTSLVSTPKLISSFLRGRPARNVNSSSHISRKHFPPSPERLDAQMRALALSQDTVVKTLLEQQQQLLETNRGMLEELRQIKTVVEQLKKHADDVHITYAKETQARSGAKPDNLRTEQDEDEEANGYSEGYWDYFVDGTGAVTRGGEVEYRVNYDICQPTTPVVTEAATTPVVNYITQATALPQYRYQYPPPPPPPTQDASRIYFPPLGPGLPFTEGQQLPQFHFHVSPVADASTSRSSVFTRLTPTGNSLFSQSPSSIIANSTWSNKPAAVPGVPHPFQIPVPTTAMNTPPSILSTPSTSTIAQQCNVPTTSIGVDSQLQTLLSSSNVYSPPAVPTENVSPGKDSCDLEQDSTEEVSGDFKPVIPLPAEIAIQTGEENEKVLFEERAKLFRFVEKEWKERGVGALKLLHNEAAKKARILMRRDQVLKVCANHNILPGMELQHMKDSDRAWIWAAPDYADDEMKLESFCVRFKTTEIALAFKIAFDRAVSLTSHTRLENMFSPSDKTTVSSNTQGSTFAIGDVGFGDKFKPKLGSWICSTCLITNLADKELCVACESLKPGSKQPEHVEHKSTESAQFVSTSQITVPTASKSSTQTETNQLPKFGSFTFGSKVLELQNSKDKDGIKKEASETNVATEKTVVGGFIFTSKPIIQSGENKEREIKIVTGKCKEASPAAQSGGTAKTSPFASFSFKLPQDKSQSGDTQDKTNDNATDNEKIFGVNEKSVFSTVNSTKHTVLGIGDSTNVLAQKPTGGDNSVFGTKSNVSNVTFSALTNVGTSEGAFEKDPNFKGFSGAGAIIFSSSDKSLTDGDTLDEFVPTAEFKPIVSLPELIDIKTGEEGEIKLFGERAKLFRYDSEGKQWKERGIGELKILHDEKTGRFRILMRREQVFKLCANHNILPGMKLTSLSSSDRSWVWFAQDYSDGQFQNEQLAAKFKTPEIAQEFHKIFEHCQSKLLSASDEKNTVDAGQPITPAKEIPDTRPLSEIFKPKPFTWECNTCYVKNSQDKLFCIACETPKPGTELSSKENSCSSESVALKFGAATKSSTSDNFNFVKTIAASSQSKSNDPNSDATMNTKGFVFGNQSNILKSNFLFDTIPNKTDSSTTETNTSPAFGFKPNLPPPSDKSGFQFGSSTFISTSSEDTQTSFSVVSSAPVTNSAPSQSLFSFPKSQSFEFNPSASGNLFNIGSSTPTKTACVTDENEGDGVHFRFGSPQKYEFSFSGVRPRSPNKTPKSPGSTTDNSADQEEVEPSEADNIYFQPVIPLPPKVEVKTGEEGEEVISSQRAKLFRYVNGEWKERGVGDLKVLRCLETGRIRLLMRRDQVLKVCLNHYLTADIIFAPKGEKTWFWVASDFTDGELHPEKFAVRFKTVEISQRFKEKIDAVQKSMCDKEVSKSQNSEKTESSAKSALASFSFCLDKDKNGASPKFSLSHITTSSAPSRNLFGNTSPLSKTETVSEEDVAVVAEKHVSPSKQAEAEKLMLPNNFYMYETKPPCPGCRGCEEEGDEDELEIIYEAKPTPEQLAKAVKLQLPPTFYLYENKLPCPGCRGCTEIKTIPKAEINPPKDASEHSVCSNEKKSVDLHMVTPSVSGDSCVFGTGKGVTELSFENLASQSSSLFTTFNDKTSKSEPCVFAGAGTPLFLHSTTESEDGNDQVESSADIHFQPIIPLPELIEVRTGEEDELPVFVHRAKLYRYDAATQQWKERGVGDFKILKHKEKCRFRLLLRREQVHKIACNHCIDSNLKMGPLATSNNALCWNAVDYADGQPVEGFFAVRFKNTEIMKRFLQTFEDCKAALKSEKEPPPAVTEEIKQEDNEPGCSIDKSIVESIITQPDKEASTNVVQEKNEESEEQDSNEEEDDLIMFEKRVTFAVYDNAIKNFKPLGIGILHVIYDDSIFAARIEMHDDSGVLHCNQFIAVQTCLRTEKNNAFWSAIDMSVDPAVKRQFRATFSSANALEEFRKIFEEGKQMAIESEILEPDDKPSSPTAQGST